MLVHNMIHLMLGEAILTEYHTHFTWCYVCGPTVYYADGQVRLVDGESEEEGRAEVCFSRRWGTITGDGWTHTESTVICNDLGYQPSSTGIV